MAVVGSAQIMGLPEATIELGKHTIRIPYRVVVSSVSDGPYTVLSAPGLPELYSTYDYAGTERNSELILRRYEAKPMPNQTNVWRVEAIYETPETKESGKGGGGAGGRDTGGGTGRPTPGEFQNPFLEIPSVKWHSSTREGILTRIYDNLTGTFKPCTASNGEVFDPPPKILEGFSTLEITRNERLSSPQPAIAVAYTNAVNSDIFWGAGAGYWRCKEVVPERQDRQLPGGPFKLAFLKVSYSFEYNPWTWDQYLLDYGTYYWARPANASPTIPGNQPAVRTTIKNFEGHPTSAPLNGRGQPLPDRVPCTLTDGSQTINIAATTPPQKFNVGDVVQFSAIPVAGQTSVTAPSPLSYNTAYYVVENTVTAGAQALKVSLTSGGAAINIDNPSNQAGWQYIYSPGIFFNIRPYARLPFRALGLPQSFMQVQ